MARTSHTMKARYTKLDEGSETCFYCPSPSSMEDLTPSPSAKDIDRESFTDQWVRVNCCRKCWGRIYTANIANAAQAFGVPKGLMTLEMKRGLIGGTTQTSTSGIVLGFDQQFYVPTGAFRDGELFLVNGVKFDEGEIKILQGPMALKYYGRPIEHIRMALHAAYASGILDMDEQEKYETILGL